MDAVNLRLEELTTEVLHQSGIPSKFKDLRMDLEALKAQNVQITVAGDQASLLNEKFEELYTENHHNRDKIDLLTSGKRYNPHQVYALRNLWIF